MGLDREAAKESLDSYLIFKEMTGNQLEFLDLVVNHLAEHGVISVGHLYDSPFTDVAARGPESLFDTRQIENLVTAFYSMRVNAIPPAD